MKCKQAREFFAEALYDELDAATRQAFDEHLVACESCAKELAGMRETISVVNKRLRIEPGAQEWDAYWQRLRQKLDNEERNNEQSARTKFIRWRPAHLPAWAYGFAAMMLLGIGIYLGRTSMSNIELTGSRQPEHQSGSTAVQTETDSTVQQTLAYLERSRNLLIGLKNLDEEQSASINFSHYQQISRALVDQGNVLTVALNAPRHQQLKQLIQDLRLILLQLANLEVSPGVPAVELVNKGVSSKSILLKINVEEIRARLNQPSASHSKKKHDNT